MDNKKKQAWLQGIAITTVILLIVVLLFLQNIYGMFSLPKLLNELFFGESANTDIPSSDGGKIYGLLSSDGENSYKSEVVITKDNFRTLVNEISLPDEFYWESDIIDYYGEASISEKIRIIYLGGNYMAEIYNGESLLRSVIDNGVETTVTDYPTEAPPAKYPSGSATVFEQVAIPTPESFLSLPDNATNYEFVLSKGPYGNMVDLEFSYNYGEAENHYREHYRISLDFGVVVSAETYENDILVYKLVTTRLVFDKDETEAAIETFASAK